MAILTSKELAAMRQAISRQFKPETWTKQTLNAALQAVEDVRVSLGLDPVDGVAVKNTTNGRAQAVQAAKDAGRVSNNILPIVEDWLASNPPVRTVRSVDETKLSVWLASNRAAFDPGVGGVPALIRDAAVLALLRLRVGEAV